jgi:hypothetical protein
VSETNPSALAKGEAQMPNEKSIFYPQITQISADFWDFLRLFF